MNKFAEEVELLEQNGAGKEELSKLLGRGRAKKGMFEGDTESGELEIGQISAQINSVKSSEEVIKEIIVEYQLLIDSMKDTKYVF